MNPKSSAALIIFIKNPILGQAKTRIAQDTGDDEALRIYKLLLEHTRQVAEQFDGDKYLYYSHFIDTDDEWSNDTFIKKLQSQEDLGGRMKSAFAFLKKQYDKLLIIGSDCYELQLSHLHEAIDALDPHDAVLGPVEDGGYYLLGMKGFYPSLFDNITWSSEEVTAQTYAQAKAHNIDLVSITQLRDVDYLVDWQRYEAQ